MIDLFEYFAIFEALSPAIFFIYPSISLYQLLIVWYKPPKYPTLLPPLATKLQYAPVLQKVNKSILGELWVKPHSFGGSP